MRRRSGFTITELLVAMALIVFVMSILATAFSEGMRTFRGLKGLGDMNQRLRTVQTLLIDDLQAKHFEGDRRLSDSNFWTIGPPREGFFRVWQGSRLDSTTSYVTDGGAGTVDIDYGIPSVRANDHILHFTVKKLGNDPKNFFCAAVPPVPTLIQYGNYSSRYQTGNTFNSQWAEVAWFLRPLVDVNGQPMTANGTPLYTLYRRQRVIVPNPDTGTVNPINTKALISLNWPTPVVTAPNYNPLPPSPLAGQGNYLNVSCRLLSTGVYFNSPADLTVPAYRFSMTPPSAANLNTYAGIPVRPDGRYTIFEAAGSPPPPGSPPFDPNDEQTALPNMTGADAVLTDVISFVVRVSTPTSGGFVDLPAIGTSVNPQFSNSTGPFAFDTGSSVVDDTVDYSLWNNPAAPNQAVRPPLQTNITAIQIQLRVWDNKTEQARQITIVVDM